MPLAPQSPYGPPAPYGPMPYQPWTQGYSPYATPAPVSGVAIASLVLGLLCCLPGVGLVLGVIALVQIRRTGKRGTAMAVTGTVLSSLGLAVWLLMLASGGLSAFWGGFEEGLNDDGTSLSVAKGECFDTPDGSLEGDTYDVDKVPCAQKHDAEVFAVFKLTGFGSDYPGDRAVTSVADDKCYAKRDGYAMDTWAVPADVDVYYLTPSPDSWDAGDREVTCVFGSTTEGKSLTGTLRNDETVLDDDQLAYLKAAGVLNAALDSAPEDAYVEDDLPGNKAWAKRVADAIGTQRTMLGGHEWPTAAKKPVATIVTNLSAAQKEWAAAARASDADAFYVHFDKGARLIDGRKTVTVRKALGLATTPPAGDADGGDGGTGDGGGSGGGDTGLDV
nr:DUF4190 domain-containing protein [Streptomyces mangrovisoli]